MDVNDLTKARENEVRGTGKSAFVKTESITETVGDLASHHLRPRVGGFDGGHDARALGFGQSFRHVPVLGAVAFLDIMLAL